ncbi:MAG: exosortase/archaeosortase family protein [Verrucomicrobia bacterium]|nr:exosortase/archaeosortase family protein [Verrucomicrobiota bacterium]
MSTESPNKISFPEELAGVWAQLPHKGLFFGLLAAWFALFHFLGNSTFGYYDTASLPGWLYRVYTEKNSEDGHGLLIPVVVLVLLWTKRAELLALPARAWWPALALLAFALVLHLFGYLVQQTRLSVIAFFLGLYSLVGLTWGAAWMRATFFPMVLFAFCLPVGSISEPVTFPMRMLVTKISVGIGHSVLGIDVVRDGSRIFNSAKTFQYDVAPACSGIRSLISLLALTTIYGFVSFGTTWKRLLIVALAVPLAVAGNVLRITGVIIAAQAFGHDAGTFVEQKLGFVTFLFAIGSLMALGHLLREKKSPAADALPSAPAPA